MTLLLKALASVVLILLASLISRKSLALGGWITAFPLITLVSIAWMVGDQRTNAEIANYLRGVTLGLIPTFVLLLIWTQTLRGGSSLAMSLCLALGTWASLTVAARYLGILG